MSRALLAIAAMCAASSIGCEVKVHEDKPGTTVITRRREIEVKPPDVKVVTPPAVKVEVETK